MVVEADMFTQVILLFSSFTVTKDCTAALQLPVSYQNLKLPKIHADGYFQYFGTFL